MQLMHLRLQKWLQSAGFPARGTTPHPDLTWSFLARSEGFEPPTF